MFSGIRRWLAAAPAVLLLYFFALTDVGMVGPDEPRYASIGREMARSGDWITPRLWGEPWFEKPPLLYWMTAAGKRMGLGDDLAPRLPVALLSVAFLVFFYTILKAEFGERAARFSTVVLGTSAGWLAFSHLGVTDLPMAATFAAAALLGLRWMSTGRRRTLVSAAVLLGLAVLAKGLVPLVLIAPLLWAARRRWRELLHPLPVSAFLLVAAPWYVLCTMRNGLPFLQDFFWKQHFARFSSEALLHGRPVWFYIPVLVGGVFPWIPMLAPLARKKFYGDGRRRLLLLWVVFGFVFFSLSVNKLPGYLLPLFPAVAALMGIALDEMRGARWLMALSCLMLLATPVINETLPRALVTGLSRSQIGGWNWWFAGTYIALAILVGWWEQFGRREGAVGLLLVAIVVAVAFLKVNALPRLDRLASARFLWSRISTQPEGVCVESLHRNWRYGLNYYSVTPLPDCRNAPRPFRIEQLPGKPPVVH